MENGPEVVLGMLVVEPMAERGPFEKLVLPFPVCMSGWLGSKALAVGGMHRSKAGWQGKVGALLVLGCVRQRRRNGAHTMHGGDCRAVHRACTSRTCAGGRVQMGWSAEDWTGAWCSWQSRVRAQVRACQREVVAPVNDACEPLQIQQTQGTAHDSRTTSPHMEPVQDLD